MYAALQRAERVRITSHPPARRAKMKTAQPAVSQRREFTSRIDWVSGIPLLYSRQPLSQICTFRMLNSYFLHIFPGSNQYNEPYQDGFIRMA